MNKERVKFKNRSGVELSGTMHWPIKGKPHTIAIFAHCFTCGKNLKVIKYLSRSFTNESIAVFSFDFTGLGNSKGDFAETNFSSNITDIIDASDFLASNYEAPSILIGHSLGGTAVIHSAGSLEHIKAVITIGAPADSLHVTNQFHGKIEEIKEEGLAKVDIGGRPFTIQKQFLDDLKNNNTLEIIKEIGKPVFIMHSPFDKIVGIENAAKLYAAANHPKNFISLDDSDHLLSAEDDALYAGKVAASWASRYMDKADIEELKTDLQVVVRTKDSFTTEVQAGIHHLTADEPADVGGNDFGPTPYDYLLVALGSCTGMTLRMYADRKKWDLKEVTVHLVHGKDYDQDAQKSEDKRSKIDTIQKVIEVEGDLNRDQKDRLLEIASKCPVHKTLLGDIKIESSID